MLRILRSGTLRARDLHLESALFSITLATLYGAFAWIYFASALPPFDATGHAIGRDFINFWSAGSLVAKGHILDVFDPAAFRPLQGGLLGRELPLHYWGYPPHMLLIAAPFAWLPYLPAFALWSVLTLSIYLLLSPRTPSLALMLAPATFVNLFCGQTGCLVGGLLIGGLRLLDARPVLAGVLFGLATIKPHLGLLIPVGLVAAGAWRPITSAVLTVLALVFLSAQIFGWESWDAWFRITVPFQALVLEEGTGLFAMMMPSAFMAARIIGLDVGYAYLVQVPFSLVAFAATWRAFRISGARQIAHATLLLATVVATPYIFNYDLTMIGPAVLLMLSYGRTEGFRSGEERLWLLVWLLPILVMVLNGLGLPVGSLILVAALASVLARLNGGSTNLD